MENKVRAFIAMTLSIVMILSCSGVVHAKDSSGSIDISEEAVDSITISGGNSDGTVNAYDDFSVTVNFSEDNADGTQKDGLDIESGDKISISWTAPDGVSFTGHAASINIYQDGDSNGTLLGTAEVKANDVTITFNDNVNSLQHVKGSVTFTIKNYGNPSSEENRTSQITAGGITQNITVKSVVSEAEFGSKGGYYSEDGNNRIYWTIWVNNKIQENLTGDVVITDKLPDTETFGGFVHYKHRNGGEWDWEVDTLSDFQQDSRSFQLSEDGRTITITIPAAELNRDAGEFRFWTTSSADPGTTVENTAKVTHYETGSTTLIEDEYTGTVDVPLSSGSASGVPKGTIKIIKVIDGTTDPVKGVAFRVYKVNSSTDHTRVSGWYNGSDYAEITTGDDGTASLSNLNDGYYEIEEDTEHLPDWIAVPSIKSIYAKIEGTSGTKVTINNSVKTGEITAVKNWTQNDGTTPDTSSHPTVHFKLYRSVNNGEPEVVNGAGIKTVTTVQGESSSKVTWSDLPLYDNKGNEYTYSVKEVDADGNDYTPAGYTKTEDGLTITNAKNITNTDVTAVKKWVEHDGTTPDTSSHPTVYFKLYRSVNGNDPEAINGADIKAVETASGESRSTVTWPDLPLCDNSGNEYTYSVKEVDADGNSYTPEGYTKTENGLTVINKLKKSSTSHKNNEDQKPNDPGHNKKDNKKNTSRGINWPKTGDTSGIGLWASLLALSAAGAALICYRKRRNGR